MQRIMTQLKTDNKIKRIDGDKGRYIFPYLCTQL